MKVGVSKTIKKKKYPIQILIQFSSPDLTQATNTSKKY